VAERRAAAGAEIVVLPDEASVAREAAQRLSAGLNRAIEARGDAHLALTGGSSAIALYRELAQPGWRSAVAWDRVHLWWGDERFVPVDHPDSNIGLAYRLLLGVSARAAESGSGAQGVDVATGDATGLPVRAENVHPYEIDEVLSESEPDELVAQRYAEALHNQLPAGRDGLPAFDVVLLGVGADGHILSAFPASPAIGADAALVMTVPAPEHIEPRLARITLNPRLLAAARQVIVMASGEDKARAVAGALAADSDPSRWPAQLAAGSNATWLLDAEAAAQLAASR
jgi:6-phosphogluconolactonase